MNMNLFLLDDTGKIERKLGKVALSFIDQIIIFATKEQAAFLSGIMINGSTVFNHMQLKHVKEELLQLSKKYSIIKTNEFDVLMMVIESALEEGDYSYLDFCI